MPKKTINDYTFYKIINVNCDVDLCYVGSSVDMKQRTRRHKSNCNNVNSASYHLKVYKTIREHGGWCEFKIIPLGYAEQLTLTEAHVIEEKYRVELCAELNTVRCHVTEEERKKNEVEWHKVYYENNKEVITEKGKVYQQVNKEAIAQQKKVYQQVNKEAITEQRKNYEQVNKEAIAKRKKVQYQINKDKIKTRVSAKITCECGCVICHGDIARHRKSKKHIDLMNNKNNIEVIHNG